MSAGHIGRFALGAVLPVVALACSDTGPTQTPIQSVDLRSTCELRVDGGDASDYFVRQEMHIVVQLAEQSIARIGGEWTSASDTLGRLLAFELLFPPEPGGYTLADEPSDDAAHLIVWVHSTGDAEALESIAADKTFPEEWGAAIGGYPETGISLQVAGAKVDVVRRDDGTIALVTFRFEKLAIPLQSGELVLGGECQFRGGFTCLVRTEDDMCPNKGTPGKPDWIRVDTSQDTGPFCRQALPDEILCSRAI